MGWLWKRGGQSTLEYLIILAVVIAGVILARDYIRDRVDASLRAAGDEIVEQTDRLLN